MSESRPFIFRRQLPRTIHRRRGSPLSSTSADSRFDSLSPPFCSLRNLRGMFFFLVESLVVSPDGHRLHTAICASLRRGRYLISSSPLLPQATLLSVPFPSHCPPHTRRSGGLCYHLEKRLIPPSPHLPECCLFPANPPLGMYARNFRLILISDLDTKP